MDLQKELIEKNYDASNFKVNRIMIRGREYIIGRDLKYRLRFRDFLSFLNIFLLLFVYRYILELRYNVYIQDIGFRDLVEILLLTGLFILIKIIIDSLLGHILIRRELVDELILCE